MVQMQKLQKVGFGGLSERFVYLGLHPSWERRGYTHKYRNIAPGCYYCENVKKPKGIGYARSLESEELSKTLNRKADHKLKAKAWIRSVNGPGWHDVRWPSRRQKFGTFAGQSRFPVSGALATPGPGTYGKEHIPQLRHEEKSKAKGFSFSDTPSFEHDNCMPRSLIAGRPYSLPPNIYKVKSFTDELLSKAVSKRGPYDLFTGARDETSVYGHLKKLVLPPRSSHFEPATVIERLNNLCNKYKGKFLSCGREAYPSTRKVLNDLVLCQPDARKTDSTQSDAGSVIGALPTRLKFPFSSSVLYARPLIKIELKPPPGRYDPYTKKRILGNGMKSAFLSRVKREIPIPEKMSWF